MKLPTTVVKPLPVDDLDFQPYCWQVILSPTLFSLYNDQPQSRRLPPMPWLGNCQLITAVKDLCRNFSTIKKFCKQYLMEYELTPFALCRDLLHKATWVVWNTPCPTVITTIDDAMCTFCHKGQVFTLPELKAAVRREIENLETSIPLNVPIVKDLMALAISFDLSLIEDSGNETMPGYSIFESTKSPDSNILMDTLIKKERNEGRRR